MEFDSIDAVREEIDQVDQQLVALIARRGECVKAAAQFKQDRAAVRARSCQQVIDKVRGQAKAQGLAEEIIGRFTVR
ncbi:chorismate mutase (plasmid) [Pseudomonas silvicola]|nr:chorismate mutase [Pseudomonas silvicola]